MLFRKADFIKTNFIRLEPAFFALYPQNLFTIVDIIFIKNDESGTF